MIIHDGTGTGSAAAVDKENRLLTRAVTISDLEHSAEEGLSFTVVSTYGATSADEVISIRNTNADRKLAINNIKLVAVDTGTEAVVWTLIEVTSGTAAGTTVTPLNMNLNSGVVAAATCFGGAAVTGSLAGNVIAYAVSNHDIESEIDLGGALLLAENDEIAVTVTDTDNPTVYVTVTMHYEESE